MTADYAEDSPPVIDSAIGLHKKGLILHLNYSPQATFFCTLRMYIETDQYNQLI